jgi:hypothetical protein
MEKPTPSNVPPSASVKSAKVAVAAGVAVGNGAASAVPTVTASSTAVASDARSLRRWRARQETPVGEWDMAMDLPHHDLHLDGDHRRRR